jgi:uncharacterized protein (TIGR03435 family)
MSLSNLSPVGNHLWQSTLFVAAVWLLTLALRNNRAAVRYWLWLAASMKFLIPFSMLVDIGRRFAWLSAAAIEQPQFLTVVTEVGRPFGSSPNLSPLASPAPATNWIGLILAGVWLSGVIFGLVYWSLALRRTRALRRAATPLPVDLPVPVLSSPTRMEPGVFGIRNPVLVVPAGIVDRLPAAQLDAVLAHELCHVRRMDNLTAAIHMVVETIFWFFPLVWWIRTRLVLERERACDEAVIGSARDPLVYAEGILNVCKLYLESPLVCVSGVTGADLKRRIEIIMARRIARDLDSARKLLLVAAGIAALAAPLFIGLLNTPAGRAQSPDLDQPVSYVASIKENKSPEARTISEYSPGGRLSATAITVGALLRIAYRIQPYQLVGLPDSIGTRRYDIAARADDNPSPPQQALIRTLLKERFKMTVHNETREMPVFALVAARSDERLGTKLIKSSRDCVAYFAGPHPPPEPGRTPTCATRIGPGNLYGSAIPMTTLAASIAPFVGRFTVDKTGLAGGYDVELAWNPEQMSPGPSGAPSPDAPPNSAGPSIFTALQEQLGLKLVSDKAPVTVLVVDRLEQPSEN